MKKEKALLKKINEQLGDVKFNKIFNKGKYLSKKILEIWKRL